MTSTVFRRWPLLTVCACALLLATLSFGQSGSAKTPAEVKTGYVVNLARFVKWPKRAFAGNDTPIRIGVIADEATKQLLEKKTAGQKAHKRPLQVEAVALSDDDSPDVEALRQFHIVYVGEGAQDSIKPLLRAVSDHPVLTISEVPEFAIRGGAIELFQSGDRIAFRVNRAALKAAGLRAHSKMLKLAEIVETDPDKAVVPLRSTEPTKEKSTGSVSEPSGKAQPASAQQQDVAVQGAGILPPLRPDWVVEPKSPTSRPKVRVPMTELKPAKAIKADKASQAPQREGGGL